MNHIFIARNAGDLDEAINAVDVYQPTTIADLFHKRIHNKTITSCFYKKRIGRFTIQQSAIEKDFITRLQFTVL